MSIKNCIAWLGEVMKTLSPPSSLTFSLISSLAHSLGIRTMRSAREEDDTMCYLILVLTVVQVCIISLLSLSPSSPLLFSSLHFCALLCLCFCSSLLFSAILSFPPHFLSTPLLNSLLLSSTLLSSTLFLILFESNIFLGYSSSFT